MKYYIISTNVGLYILTSICLGSFNIVEWDLQLMGLIDKIMLALAYLVVSLIGLRMLFPRTPPAFKPTFKYSLGQEFYVVINKTITKARVVTIRSHYVRTESEGNPFVDRKLCSTQYRLLLANKTLGEKGYFSINNQSMTFTSKALAYKHLFTYGYGEQQ